MYTSPNHRFADFVGYTHFGSVHSWMGALTLVSTAVMFLFGLFTFLIVRDDADWKRASLPVHRYFGYVTFVCSLATVLLGYGEIAVEGREIANLLPCGIALTIVSIGGTLFYGFIPSEGEEFDYRSVNVWALLLGEWHWKWENKSSAPFLLPFSLLNFSVRHSFPISSVLGFFLNVLASISILSFSRIGSLLVPVVRLCLFFFPPLLFFFIFSCCCFLILRRIFFSEPIENIPVIVSYPRSF